MGGQSGLRHGCVLFLFLLEWHLSDLAVAERPIRSFEMLSDVTNSWVTDKTVNVLMAKKTLLAPKLSRAVSIYLCLRFFTLLILVPGYPIELSCLWWLRTVGVQAREVAETLARA